MQNQNAKQAFLISELERRCYLFLIGGDYERLFYNFIGNDAAAGDGNSFNIERIKLDIEVDQQAKMQQIRGQYADPEYKGMLDYILGQRLNRIFENDPDLFSSSEELQAAQPLYRSLGQLDCIDQSVTDIIEATPWLQQGLQSLAGMQYLDDRFNFKENSTATEIARQIGYNTFMWMLPVWISEAIARRMHPSMQLTFARMQEFVKIQYGSSIALASRYDNREKSYFHLYSVIDFIPLTLILCTVNRAIIRLQQQQRVELSRHPCAKKSEVLDQYAMSGDLLFEFMSMEELLKPFILESIGFEVVDPLQYILGYSPDNQLVTTYFQSRAYTVYRQLFRNGRIQTQETAMFLRHHQIDKRMLTLLNEAKVTSIDTQFNLIRQLPESQPKN